jgi:uncharacterized protein YqhQ
LVGFFEGMQIEIPKKEEDKNKNSEEKPRRHILLKIWVAVCIFASFVAALVLTTLISTYIQNLMAFNKDCTI